MNAGNMPPIRQLYLHIPFCHRICPYCSFYKHLPGETDQAAFLRAIVKEAEQARKLWGDRLELETIYWGGGTPSLLSVRALESFLPALHSALGEPKPGEWTVEMNPVTLTPAKLEMFRQHGVTRASLGVQAWDCETLQTLGRDHSPEQAEEAYQMLRTAEFPKVSLDLMFSVPGQALESWCGSLEKTISLQPDHISCYNLTYEEDTAYFERFQKGEYTRDEHVDEAFFSEAMDRLQAAGYAQYEISNYAREGSESLHNRGYWRGADYLGLGPSAVSTIDRVRLKNVSDTAAYVQCVSRDESPAMEAEHLTPDQWRCERLALELRTSRGVDVQWLECLERQVGELSSEGLAEMKEGRLCLTRRGKMVADSVIAHLWS